MSINDNDDDDDDDDNDEHVDNHRRNAYVNIWQPMFVSFQCQARTESTTFVLSLPLWHTHTFSLPPFFVRRDLACCPVLSLYFFSYH